MSDGMVKLPGVGPVKKQYVYVGGALVVGFVGYAYWNRASAAPADVPAYDSGDITADGVTDTAGGVAGGSANSGGASTDSSTTPDTDQEWVQQAASILGGAMDVQAVFAALGAYITHQPLTAAQESIVRSAIGALGYPPGGAYPITTGTGATPSTLGQVPGLHVTAHGLSTIDLAWTTVSGAPGYRIYRADLGDEPIGDSADTKFQVRGLQPNTTYRFTVAARQGNGSPGPKSSVVSGKTSAANLTPPKGLKASAVTRSSVHVTCSPVAGANRYGWYVNGVAHGSSDGPAYTIVGLRANTSYKLSVAADNSTQGPGKQSSAIAVKTKK